MVQFSKRKSIGSVDQIWDPVSGTTVKCAVSSLRRSHTSFSKEENAAVSLAKVRMFFRSLWNLIVDYVRECSS